MKLRLKLPDDKQFENEMIQATNSETHEEMEAKISRMSDETFIQIVQQIMRRRRKAAERYVEEHRRTEEIIPYA